ncbi:MAG: amino acid racemase [Actinomycetia bacterium]|nr:amino acid racemase [Actinomycetes bacterium]
MKHIGILAHSVPGAALCFRECGEEGMRLLGGHNHPDVSLDCIAMGASMEAWESGDHDRIRAILAASVERLARAGADFFVCPDNTAHLALERPGPEFTLPGLHIADVVARSAVEAGHRTVGVLGTKWTMEADLYPRAFGAYGIETRVPDPDERDVIQGLTFGELVHGVFTDRARETFVSTIERLRQAGCDAVALVCTEFPLLVTPEVSTLPTLESTTLAARSAIRLAVGDDDLPAWRGGAVRA